jgi:M6 family metalloprotease-like protein
MNRALALLAVVVAALTIGGATAAGRDDTAAVASGFDVVKFPAPQPACAGVGLRQSPYLTRNDCGFGEVTIDGASEGDEVTAILTGADGSALATETATFDEGAWQYDIAPSTDWPAGPVTVAIDVNGTRAAGTGTFFLNQMGGTVAPAEKAGGYRPGEPIPVHGEVYKLQSVGTDTQKTGAPGQFRLRANGEAFGPFTANDDGTFDATIPAAATQDLHPGRATGYRQTIRIEFLGLGVDDDGVTGSGFWSAPDGEPAGAATVSVVPDELVLENSFVSSKGWVKPGDRYPFTVRVKNYTDTAKDGGTVTITVPDGATLSGSPSWDVGTVRAATDDGPGVVSKVFEATADTLAQDPEIAWKDLSSDATLNGVTETSHGPKVIPPTGGYETARYGDRPFPVVPVDFSDRAHGAGSSAGRLQSKINDPDNPGSTFNLYQEMSYGQLFPHADVPSAGLATAGWDYDPGFSFTQNATEPDTCHGLTNATLPGNAYQQLQPERIKDGWYQLPGSTDYYGDDGKGSAMIGALTGVGALQDIDSACGPTGKAVYDAAQIADPEIDYNDFDTDKDGVVDFFMMVFAGIGGNGASQTSVPPYDNIWPHSSDLQGAYVDEHGEKGYVSDDQLTDLEGRPLFWTDAGRTSKTTQDTGIPVHVRVGPYNVNPETAIDHASVISHEYGHSLGLPDYYSTGSRETYGAWTLMATDYSQNIDVIGRKELGWVVPRELEPGQTRTANGWQDSKLDTHRIDWKRPDGTPYALEGPRVHNGEAYIAKLPGRQIIDPADVPSGDHVWWSRSGNDFGCPPSGGHNLDIALPTLADVPAGSAVTLEFKSRWDTEWDFDYGFVLATTDNGRTYTSYASQNGYTTPASQNPNANGCQQQYGNGLTGSSGSYAAGTATVDRLAGNYPDATFVDDAYDLSDLAGKNATLRLTYATDPGLARPGWFIDDLVVKVDGRPIYQSDFETATDPALFNGGCREGLATAQECTDGWQWASAAEGSPAEHAYLLEMRDRSGFDATGRGESERGIPTFAPGVYLGYTDENHGYGNVGTDNPPAQSPLDANPEPGSDTPNLDDAAFKQGQSFSDAGSGHVDNYGDATRADGQWRFDFDCLGFDVTSLSGAGIGPEAAGAYDLAGDVTFHMGGGCASDANAAPTAVVQAKPARVAVGKPVTLDGSGSYDDGDAADALTYAWDVDGNGTTDRQGRQIRHTYSRAGVYRARLTVTDTRGRSASATVPVVVAAAPVRAAAATTCTVPPTARVSHGRLIKPAGATVKVTRRGSIRIVRTTSGGMTQRTAYVRKRGRLRALPAFEYRGCGALKAFRLSGPTFKRALKVTVSPRMPVEIVRAGKTVRRLSRSGTVRHLRAGRYSVRAGGVTLRARRV